MSRIAVLIVVWIMHCAISPRAHAVEPNKVQLSLPPSYLLYLSPSDEATTSLQQAGTDASSERRECKARYMAGPAVGIGLGVSSMVLGSIMVSAGTNYSPFASSEGSNVPGLIGGGSALLAAGAGALVFSAIKTKRNVKARARVCGSRP